MKIGTKGTGLNVVSFKKNAALNVLGMLLPTLIFLVITPVMIKELGVAGFGIILWYKSPQVI